MMIKNITSLSNGAVFFLDQNYDRNALFNKKFYFRRLQFNLRGSCNSSEQDARIIFEESKFINNFAINGGVVYVTD